MLLENKAKKGIHIYASTAMQICKSQTRKVQGIHGKDTERENQVPDATKTILWMLRANE